MVIIDFHVPIFEHCTGGKSYPCFSAGKFLLVFGCASVKYRHDAFRCIYQTATSRSCYFVCTGSNRIIIRFGKWTERFSADSISHCVVLLQIAVGRIA